MTRRALALTGAVVGAILVAALVATSFGWWRGAPSGGAAPTEPLAVQTELMPNPSYFGDPVDARVSVAYDALAVAPGSVQVETDFTPYVEAAPPTITRSRFGATGSVVYAYHLQCLTEGCLPQGRMLTLSLGRAVVTARSGNGAVRQAARWPELVVTPRVTPAEAAGSAHFRNPSTLPGTTYRVSPELVTGVLAVAALALAVAALVLVGKELARWHDRRRRDETMSPRAIALAYVREAADRGEGDRRKALGLLAETLAAEGEQRLGNAADDAAWSEDPPTSARTLQLADEVQAAAPSEPS